MPAVARRILIAVPPDTKASVCSGPNCRKTIYWIKTAKGKLQPIDVNVPDGKPPRSSAPLLGDAGEVGQGVAHWATCVDAERFRRPT